MPTKTRHRSQQFIEFSFTMEMIEFLPYERLRSVPEAERDAATVVLSRGHDGMKHPYSTPFTLNVQVEHQVVWWATLNFDRLYVDTGYDGPQLFARYCSMLLRIVEGKPSYEEKPVRHSVWQAVWETCYSPTDKVSLQAPEDMSSRRADFTRKTWAEMAAYDPREFHAYSMNTVSAANSRGSTDRTEFRVVSRPDAGHRWLFWTHVPWRLSGHPAEMAYWFERHVAQLRGPRRPSWTVQQKQRWTDAVLNARGIDEAADARSPNEFRRV